MASALPVPRRSWLSRQLVDAPGGGARGLCAVGLAASLLLGVVAGLVAHQAAAFARAARPAEAIVLARHPSAGRGPEVLEVLLAGPGATPETELVPSRLLLPSGLETRRYEGRPTIAVLVDPAHPRAPRLAADPGYGAPFLTFMAVVFLVVGAGSGLLAHRLARRDPDWRTRDARSWQRAAGQPAPPAAPWPGPGRPVVLQARPPHVVRAAALLLAIAAGLVLVGLSAPDPSARPWFDALAALCLLPLWQVLFRRAVVEPDGTLVVGVRPLGRRVPLQQALTRVTRARPRAPVVLELGVPGRLPVRLPLTGQPPRSPGPRRLLVDAAALPVLGAGLLAGPSTGARELGARLRTAGSLRPDDPLSAIELDALALQGP